MLCIGEEPMAAMRHELEQNGCVFTKLVPSTEISPELGERAKA